MVYIAFAHLKNMSLIVLFRIIVGVKYCFRYNARNRAIARGENPDETPLENLPAGRPHRRRREKKLMTMDEVNERFPLVKYKNWTAARAQEGLSTAGGVAADTVTSTPSRATSVRHSAGIVPPSPSGTKHSLETARAPPEIHAAPRMSTEEEMRPNGILADAAGKKTALPTLTEVKTAQTTEELEEIDIKEVRTSHDDDSDDEAAHIHDALPVDVLEHPGDACAICIDTLEADDDVRGLTCGHAFHAGCLDPWLTSRRACCPLCKADYFVPKPKPEGADAATEGRDSAGRRRRGVQPPPPVHTGWALRVLPRPLRNPWMAPQTGSTPRGNARTERSRRVAEARAEARANAEANPAPAADAQTRAQGGGRRFLPNMRMPFRRQGTDAPAASADVTPQQLEAGSPAVR